MRIITYSIYPFHGFTPIKNNKACHLSWNKRLKFTWNDPSKLCMWRISVISMTKMTLNNPLSGNSYTDCVMCTGCTVPHWMMPYMKVSVNWISVTNWIYSPSFTLASFGCRVFFPSVFYLTSFLLRFSHFVALCCWLCRGFKTGNWTATGWAKTLPLCHECALTHFK